MVLCSLPGLELTYQLGKLVQRSVPLFPYPKHKENNKGVSLSHGKNSMNPYRIEHSAGCVA